MKTAAFLWIKFDDGVTFRSTLRNTLYNIQLSVVNYSNNIIMLILASLGVAMIQSNVNVYHTLSEPGNYVFRGDFSSSHIFELTNSSCSAQFLFATEEFADILIDSGNVNLTKPHFLFIGSGTVNITFPATKGMDFRVWVIPTSWCEDRASAFAANASSRFRLQSVGKGERRCIFTINADEDKEFILFSRGSPDSGQPVVFAITNESLRNGTFWISGRDELPRTTTSSPVFYGYSDVAEGGEWALNVNFSNVESDLLNSCFFEGTLVYDGITMNDTTTSSVQHIYQCGVTESEKTWVYIMFAILLLISVIIIVGIGMCCYRSWNNAGEGSLRPATRTEDSSSDYRNLDSNPFATGGDMDYGSGIIRTVS